MNLGIFAQNLEATVAVGELLGKVSPPGTCILLHGPLGAGKTQLARGIALGAQISDPGLISSPTYVLMNIYPPTPNSPDAKTVYHLDAYRTHGAEDFAAIDLNELLSPTTTEPAIVVIEWPERIAELLPADRVEVTLEPLHEISRQINIHATGPQSQKVLELIKPLLPH